MSGREGNNLITEPNQVFRLTGKYQGTVVQLAIEQRANADRIPCSNQRILFAVIENHGKLSIQLGKHLQPVFVIKRKDNFTVGVTDKMIFLR